MNFIVDHPFPSYFSLSHFVQHGLHSADFKGEAITFKATTAGILATLGHCLDLMTQREEAWRRRLDREQAARRVAEEKARHAVSLITQSILLVCIY